MIPNYKNIHNRFKINGFHLDKEALFQLAYSFIKEGEIFEKEIGEFLLDWLDDSDTIQLMTSGTTGEPKLITLEKQAMVLSAIATADFFDLHPGDKALLCLPTRYIAGKMMLVRAFTVGLELDIMPSSSHLDNLLPQNVYDFVALVPMQAQQSISKLNQFKKIIIGGAPVSRSLSEALQNLKCEAYETYGMTETITHIAARKINESTFKVLPNINIATDDRNCLIITAPEISSTPIVTNDIVEISNKNEFKWLGRFDNVINSAGIKLFPEQIAAKLASDITQRFFIAGVFDETLGQKVILVIEGEEYAIDKALFEILDKYEKPKEIYFVPSFYMTETNKINIKKTLSKIGF